MIGIYCIRNKVNNKIYIGSSVDIDRRFRKHRTQLNTKVHSNKHLIKAYHKYGKDNFEFIILEECLKEDLIDREMFYIEKYDSLDYNKGYNLTLPVKHPSIVCSKEYSEIMSKANKGRTPSNYDEMRKKNWKAIEVYQDGKLIYTFANLKETEETLGIKRGNVYNFLNGKTPKIKSHPNLIFKHKL